MKFSVDNNSLCRCSSSPSFIRLPVSPSLVVFPLAISCVCVLLLPHSCPSPIDSCLFFHSFTIRMNYNYNNRPKPRTPWTTAIQQQQQYRVFALQSKSTAIHCSFITSLSSILGDHHSGYEWITERRNDQQLGGPSNRIRPISSPCSPPNPPHHSHPGQMIHLQWGRRPTDPQNDDNARLRPFVVGWHQETEFAPHSMRLGTVN